MSIYAIGDVQGCYDTLRALLDKLSFDPARDSLWFTGDLVNRGGQSLETLRFIKGLGERAVVVLGNHDLHLLAEQFKPLERRQKNQDLRRVLEAEDGKELLAWLLRRPLLHHDPQLNFVMVHAGLAPQWNLERAKVEALRVHDELTRRDPREVLLRMYGDRPRGWGRRLRGQERTRATINALTRMRFCNAKGEISFEAKGAPGTQPVGYYPWFEVPGARERPFRVVCGHWSALGRFEGLGVYGVDTGCVWGGRLTALKLDDEDPCFISQRSIQPRAEGNEGDSEDGMRDRD